MHLPSPADVDAILDGLVLPDTLLVGTASSGYQVEGGFNGPGEPRNNWVAWERRGRNEPAGRAAAAWSAPERDLDLARALSLNAIRLGVEWARVQPDGPGDWDEGAVASYARLFREARRRGLEPLVTLHHFTHPAWAGADFWLHDDAPARFSSYVRGLLARLGNHGVRQWITVNEPNAFAAGTYLSAWLPSGDAPGLGLSKFVRCLDALHAAHVLAYDAIHESHEKQGLPAPLVSFNGFALDLYGLDRFFVDLLLSRSRGVTGTTALEQDLCARREAWDSALAPVTRHARAASLTRGLASRLVATAARRLFVPSRFPRTLEALRTTSFVRPLDFIALDYYAPALSDALRFTSGRYEPWHWPVHPDGLYDVLRANATDGLPVLVAENGLATEHARPRADGVTRDAFIRAHVFHLLRAIRAGVKVHGYLHWSLTDNYEWGRFSPRFGLFGVDYDDPSRARLATDASGVDAAGTYARLARALGDRDLAALRNALLG